MKKDGSWYVSRCYIPLDHYGDIGGIAGHLFPRLRIWQEQQRSAYGDKSTAAENFLFHLLPHLSRVTLQDAPFWMERYPNNEAVVLLWSVMPQDFPRWCQWARQCASNHEQARGGAISEHPQSGCSTNAQQLVQSGSFGELEPAADLQSTATDCAVDATEHGTATGECSHSRAERCKA